MRYVKDRAGCRPYSAAHGRGRGRVGRNATSLAKPGSQAKNEGEDNVTSISRNFENASPEEDMAATRELSRSWVNDGSRDSERGRGMGREKNRQLPDTRQRGDTAADRLAATLGLVGGNAGSASLDELDSELDSAQSIRRILLEVALDTHRDPAEALDVAMKMAEFVLQGDAVEADIAAGVPGSPSVAVPDGHVAERLGMTQSHVRWTPEQDEDVRQLWNAGLPVVEIASRLGRTPASINSRVRTLRLSKRRSWRADAEAAQGNEIQS